MSNIIDHSTKVKRALRMSFIGANPGSAAAMLDSIPAEVVDALPARLIALMLDANWRLAQESKVIALCDAVSEGAIWDARSQKLRDIAA